MDISQAVLLAKEGNNDAFTFLYENTYSRSHYTALKYLGNEDMAQDVLQLAYIKAFKHLDMLNDPSKFAPWVARIVANLSINELKKENPILFSETENEDEQDISDTFQDDRIDNQPELALDQKETTEIVQEIIGELTDEQRVCITMFYMDEMSVKEMATMLNVSENTVKSRLNYGRQKIKAKVEELEKKGVKIMGVAPIMFFLIAFKTDAKACELSASALAGVTASSAKVASGNVAKSVATKAAKSKFKGIVPTIMEHKAIATVATVAIVGGVSATQIEAYKPHEELLENYAQSLNNLSGTGFQVVVVEEAGVTKATIDQLDEGLVGYTLRDDGENLLTMEYSGGELALNSYVVDFGNKISQVDSFTIGEPFEIGDAACTDAFAYTGNLQDGEPTIVIEKRSAIYGLNQEVSQIYLIKNNEDGTLEDISYVYTNNVNGDTGSTNNAVVDMELIETLANASVDETAYKNLSDIDKIGALSYESKDVTE